MRARRREFRRHIAAELRAELLRTWVALGWDIPDAMVLADAPPRSRDRLVPRGVYLGWTEVTDMPMPANSQPLRNRWLAAPSRRGQAGVAKE